MKRLVRALPVCAALAACAPEIPSTTSAPSDGRIPVGEEREVTLRYLRFDVSNFETRMTREDLLALPLDVRERMWLLDLDLSSGPNKPQLLDNALNAIRALDPESLPQAARNMQALLVMTPDTANLVDTKLEELVDLAPLMGLAPEQVLADLFHINVEDPFLTDDVVAAQILEDVIGSHPNAKTRLGPRTDDNPEGLYEVTPGTLPISLGDIATDFQSFSERFGAYARGGQQHPGFVVGETKSNILTDDFAMTVRANANALPYKGLDLGEGAIASVSSVRSQIQGIFDFDDPNWLKVEGLVAGTPMIESMTFRIVEDDGFAFGGTSNVPAGVGASDAWKLPRWTLEHVLVASGRRAFETLDSFVSYTPPGREEALFEATVEQGWQSIVVQGGLGNPPRPSYVWDLLVEIGQRRLHDGSLAEGEADVEFSLTDVPLGFTTAELEERIRENLARDPYSLVDIAQQIIDNGEGEADLYYYRASASNAPALQGDWLFFTTEDDIPRDDDGELDRPYTYQHIGFYADVELTEKLSEVTPLDGDVSHEKIKLAYDMELFAEDDEGAVFKIRVGPQPSPNRRTLKVTRVK